MTARRPPRRKKYPAHQVSVRPSTHAALTAEAKKRGCTTTALVDRLVVAYLDAQEVAGE